MHFLLCMCLASLKFEKEARLGHVQSENEAHLGHINLKIRPTLGT